MQVAEKRADSKKEKISLAKKQRADTTAQKKRNGVHQLTEVRGVYAATGDGTPVYAPALSAEASQPTPFMSLSWQQWLEMREQVIRNLDRFVSAAEEHRADKVLSAGMEIQAAINRIFLEAYVMSADLDLSELPGK